MRAASASAAVALCASSFAACAADPSEPETSAASSEVLGGANAAAGKWPDVAAVLFNGQQGCTGVLVAPTIALTAGHCNDADLTSILVGTTSLARPGEGQTLQVARRIEYPNSLASEDLTVLVLASPSRFAPRALATGWARLDIKNGARVSLVGYGAVDRNANQYINDLQEAETTITDADCTQKPGCNASVSPGGELGAGGMGIDTCPGDSGGPLYLLTDYGAFVAGITSRAYDDAQFPCTDGGIYGRPDKVIAWIEEQAGVPVTRGPEPAADRITTVRGHGGETVIVPNDPKGQAHVFKIFSPPRRGTAKVREDGRVRVCAEAGVAGEDSLVVNVADATDPARNLDVRIPVTIQDGDPGTDCSVDEFEDDGDGAGGCCDSGRNASGSLPLALGVLLVLRRRRR